MNPLILVIIKYKYLILIPAGFLEGHIVSLIAGFLSHLGYLHPILAGLCIATGNLLGDIALYWLGYHKGEAFIRRKGSYLGITEPLVEKGRILFHKHKGWILMISKLTNGFGFAIAILFSAGVAHIPFRTFMLWNVIGEFLWTGLLISIGYFFGTLYTTVGSLITKVSIGVVFAVILVFLFIRMKKYFKNKLIS